VQRSLRMQRAFCDTWGPAWGLWLRACLAAATGDFGRAARLFGSAARQQEEVTRVTVSRLLPFFRVQQQAEQQARGELGEQFDVEVQLGRSLSPQDTVELALHPVPPPAVDYTASRPGGLTTREVEVAEQIGRGLKNRQIAETLHVAPRTIDTHVQNIMAKLN